MTPFLRQLAQTLNRGRIGVERQLDPVGRVTRIDVCMPLRESSQSEVESCECKRAEACHMSTDLDPPARVLAFVGLVGLRSTLLTL